MAEIKYNYVPQVLFLGNGILQAFGGVSWKELLKELSPTGYEIPKDSKCPMSLQAIIATDGDIRNAMIKHKDKMFGEIRSSEMRQKLRELLSMGFDDIITTNYGYELETAPTEATRLSNYALKNMCKSIVPGGKVEPKYIISSYYDVPYNDHSNRIWHIHGEARKPDSMIIGHYYYVTLIERITEYVKSREYLYHTYRKNGVKLHIKSWIDSFVLGDVYFLGFGLDYAETDIWWLINRKKREKVPQGKIHYYMPSVNEEKEKLLRTMGVEVHNLSDKIESENVHDDNFYKKFYAMAIEDMKQRMMERGTKI